ncbi:TrmH family RNA methyltransferase [Anaeroselena agilis]|uniref:RNA methyltransferase n=1 Tax=Anaeroselena agilis TaxID=3063788 RepID=A0ABU3NVX6_9FIRM|nr:RNA methyltransferase [Selenomonadales bacterium 4137-cl]
MTESIASAGNQLVKTVASLRQKKYRDELGLFTVEGVRLAEETVAAGWLVDTCVFTAAAEADPRAAKLIGVLQERQCRLVRVPDHLYAKISDTREPQGIMLVTPKRAAAFDDILSRMAKPIIAVLDGVQDPGNAGTVIRAADAAGCSGVVMLKGCVDLYAGKTVRATMGSLFHLPVVAGMASEELIRLLAAAGIPLIATDLSGATVYSAADLSGPAAIVFGNEGAGVGAELLACAAERIVVPIYGKAESLNVATAAAVILYEAARQRLSTL